MKAWRKINSTNVPDSDYVKVNKDHVAIDNGMEINDFYKITIENAAIIIGLTEDEHVIVNYPAIQLPSSSQ